MARKAKRVGHRINVSVEGMCAVEAECYPLRAIRKYKGSWFNNRRLRMGVMNGEERVFVLGFLRRDGRCVAVMMEAITGFLFNPRTGECLSSKLFLATGFRKSSQCRKWLLSFEPIEIGGQW